MKNKLKDSITIKILFAMCICIVSFTLVSSLVISALLGSRLSERARQTNEQYLITIRNQLNGYIGELNTLGALCASNQNITQALGYHTLNNVSAKRMCLKAQEALDSYLSSSSLTLYATRLAIYYVIISVSLPPHQEDIIFPKPSSCRNMPPPVFRTEPERPFIPGALPFPTYPLPLSPLQPIRIPSSWPACTLFPFPTVIIFIWKSNRSF